MPPPLQGAEAHARGLPLLGAIQGAVLPEQGVPSAPAPRRQRASKPLVAPCWLGASAESSRRRRRRARRPTPAGFPYWGRSKPPFCLSKVCSPRPCRASSASQSTSGRPPGWERRLRPRAAAAGALGGPRPRAPAIGGDTRYLSARARRAICARTAPSARLEAFWATWLT